MEGQLRFALGGRTTLRFTTTWAELEEVVGRVSPSAIFADPVAYRSGDPQTHLARFSRDERLVSVVDWERDGPPPLVA